MSEEEKEEEELFEDHHSNGYDVMGQDDDVTGQGQGAGGSRVPARGPSRPSTSRAGRVPLFLYPLWR